MENNNYQSMKRSTFNRWLVSLGCVALCLFASTSDATTIISPTGEGGFESGSTFAANNWTVVNTATANGSQWFVTTTSLTNGSYTFAPSGSRAAYVSNNAGTNWRYNTTAAAASSHLYKDVTFPAAEPLINLSFRWNASGESTWDILYVYLCPQTLTPVANSPSSSTSTVSWTGTGTATLLGSFNLLAAGSGQTNTIVIPASVAGNTVSATNMRLVFTWKNDGSGGTEPPAALDDISLVSSSCATNPVTGTKTIGTGGDYATLTAAIADINSRGVSGNVFLELNSAYTSTSETFPITLGANGCMNSSNTVTIRPGSGVTGKSITSTNTTATIDFNGGNYWIIDGRAGGSGASQLTISNTSSSTGGTPIRFINDASNNTVQYSTILQGFGSTTNGSIVFSTGLTTGNDNNTISNNNINCNATAYNGIYASGTSSTISNDNETISNNNIFDFFAAASADWGILVSSGNSGWSITGNSLYQTATRTMTTAATDGGIQISNSSATTAFTISNNYIGGSSANAAGTAWTIAGSIANRFRAMSLSVGSTATSSIQGNTIANFNFTSNSSSTTAGGPWCGIYLTAGNANIGTTTGNIIGSGTGNGSIVVSVVTNSGARSSGIFCDATSTVSNISNNVIGSFTANASTISQGFSGIVTSAGTTLTISGNTIGSTSTSNSINLNSGATSTTAQVFKGISNTSSATISITNNTIANVFNNYLPSSANTSTHMVGIESTSGLATITGNTIRNFSCPANGTGTTSTASIQGIYHTGSTAGAASISQNTIYALANTHASAAVSVLGIYNSYSATSSTCAISRNLIYNLAASSTAALVAGISSSVSSATCTYSNNMIRLGYDVAGSALATAVGFNGIVEGTGTSNFYHNTVYIGGTGVGTTATNTFAFNTVVTTNTRAYQDNIFINDRSNATTGGKHYAYKLGTSMSGLTSNYNIIRAGGTGGVFGQFNAADVASLSAWQTATSADANSKTTDPCLAGPTSATPNLHLTDCATLGSPADGAGTNIAAVTVDFDGDTRASYSPVDIGADAGNYGPSGKDVAITGVVSPTATSCHSATEALNVTLSNLSTTTLDFTVDPVTVIVNVSGAATSTYTVTVNTGTLAGGSSQSVNVGTLNTTANGTYTIASSATVSGDVNTGNDANTTNVVINYTSPSVAVTSSPTSICMSGIAAITAVGSNGTTPYQYSLNGGANQSSGSFSTGTISATQVYTVTLTDACGITATNTVTVTVNNPSVTGTTPPTRCGTGSVSLAATVSAGSTANWYTASSGGTAVATGSPYNVASISSTTTYYVSASSTPITATIGAAATGSACGTITSSSFTDWPLRFNTTGTATISQVTVIPYAAGTFTVALRNSLSSTDLQTASFTFVSGDVGVPKVINLGFTISAAGSYQLTNTVGGVYRIGTFTCSYPYTTPSGTVSIVGSASTSTSSTVTTSYNSFYNLVITESCESGRTAVVATVNTAPTISVSGTSTICSGQSTTLTASSSNDPNYVYTWNPGSLTGASQSVSPTSTTTYTVTANDAGTGCQAVMNYPVTVNPTPSSVTASASTSLVCTSGSVDLTSSASSGETTPVSFSQDFESGTFPPTGWTLINAGSGNQWASSTSSHTGTGAMSYTYNSSFAANAWAISPGYSLNGGTTYTVSFWYKVISSTFPEKLKVTVGSGATVVDQSTTLWDNNGGTNLINTTYAQGTATFTPSSTGTYYFGWNCYSDADEDVLYVDDITITGTSPVPCTFAWTSTPSGFTSSSQNPTGVAISTSTTYTVTASNTAGCSATASVAVTVNTPSVTISGTSTICTGGSTVLTATASGATTTYQWYNGASPISGETNATYTATAAGSYSVQVVTDGCPATSSAFAVTMIQYSVAASAGSNGSISPSGTANYDCGTSPSFTITPNAGYQIDDVLVDGVSVGAVGSYTFSNISAGHTISASFVISPCTTPATASAGSNATICGGNYTLGGSIGGAATSATWSSSGTGTFNPSNVFGTATSYTPSAADIAAGTVTITLTTNDPDGPGSCTPAVSSLILTVGSVPTVSLSANCTTLISGNSAVLTTTASAAPHSITTYQYTLNGTTPVGPNGASYTTSVLGSYTVTVTSSVGCTATSSAVVLVAASGPLSGTYTIGTPGCNNYPTMAAAASDLNTRGVSGNVTFQVAAGYTETAPVGGIIFKQCALAVGLQSGPTQTVTFVKSGSGANPKINAFVGTGTTTYTDNIIKVVGMDNVTFDGIDLFDGNTASALTEMEAGLGVYKCDGNNGANNVTYTNGVITLNRANTSAIGVRVANTTETGTSVSYTGATGDATAAQASRNKVSITNNTITNTYGAVLFNANTGSTGTISLNDTLNTVSGNTFTTFGGSSTALTVVSYNDNRGIVCTNNSFTTVASGHTGTLTCINGGSGPHGSITGNTITISPSNTTTAVTGITWGASGTGNTASISNNIIQNCSLTSATSSAFTGISCGLTGTGANITLNGNTFSSNTLSGTGAMSGISITSAVTAANATYSVNGNTLNGNTKTSTGNLLGISSSAGSTTLTGTMNNNSISNFTLAGGGAACLLYAMNLSSTTAGLGANWTFNSNTISGLAVSNMTGTAVATVAGIINQNPNNVNCSYTNNSISSISLNGSSTGTHLVVGIYTTGPTSDTRTISGNTVGGLTTTPAATSAVMAGIFSGSSGTLNMFKNKVYDFTSNGSAAAVYGLYVSSGSNNNVYNNLVGGINSSNATTSNAVIGINMAGGTSNTVSFNSVYLTGTTTGGASGINIEAAATSTTLRSNLVHNTLTPGGSFYSAALRRGTATLTSFGSASDNNLYYASNLGNNVLYFDGTTGYTTMTAYKGISGMSPREQSSVTENVTANLTSTTGSNTNFLHFNSGATTLAESGGISVSGISDDYDGNTRAFTPDIGADEFSGTVSRPYVSTVSITPSGNQCTATSRTVTADVIAGGSPITGVNLVYAMNGGTPSTVAMTFVSGNTWTGTIPAATTPVYATVTWSVIGTDGTYNANYVGASYQDQILSSNPISAISSASSVCSGSNITLTAQQQVLSSAPADATYCVSTHTNGCSGDNIAKVVLNTINNTTGTACGGTSHFTYFNGGGSQTTTLTAGTPYTISVTFGTDGNQYFGAWIDYDQNGTFDASEFLGASANAGASGTTSVTFTPPVTCKNGVTRMRVIGGNDSPVTSSQACGASSSTWGETQDYDVTLTNGVNNFINVNASGFTSYSWSDGSSTLGTGNPATVTTGAAGSTVYTVTATAASGCTITASTSAVNVIALPAAPTAVNSTQCGTRVPLAAVNGAGGPYKWYLVASGGSPLSGETQDHLTSYTISSTTTFYVSESDGTCESLRTPVIATVTSPTTVSATSTVSSVCPNTSFGLNATSANDPNYTYTWTASPATNSGIPTSLSGASQTISATAAGTYTYTVSANDASSGCATTAQVIVNVITPPAIYSATAVPSTVCSGDPVTLTALYASTGPLAGQIGTGTATTTSQPNPYYTTWWGNKNQYLILASELTAAGYSAGNITSLGFNLGSVSTTLSLTNYTISIGNTALTVMPATFQTGLTQVYTNPSYNVIAAANTITNHTFSTPFYWNGTSNLIIETCMNNSAWNGSQTISYTPTAANSAIYYNADASTVCSAPGTPTASVNRPNMYIGGTHIVTSAGSYTWQWSPGTIAPGNVATVNPTSSTVYTVTANDGTCSSTATVSVTVNPRPADPVVFDDIQCGPGVPTCQALGSGDIHWYLTPTGGTPIAGETGMQLTSYTISSSTIFYVADFDGTCESNRVPVQEFVVDPGNVTISATSPACQGAPITLTLNDGSPSYPWSSYSVSSTAGSGASTPLTGTWAPPTSLTVTPTAAGTYTYTLGVTDGFCNALATTTVNVAPAPLISSATASPATLCLGESTTLTALTNDYAPGTVNIGGAGTTTLSTSNNPYRSGNGTGNQIRTQLLVLASELTAQGMAPGNITSLAFTTTSSTTGTLSNLTIALGNTSVTALSNTFETTPVTTVFTASSFTPLSSGLNVHTFSTPFYWNGTSNLLINVCQTNNILGTATVQASTVTFNADNHISGTTTGCTDASGNGLSLSRPIMQFGAMTGAQGPGTYTWTWNPGSLSGNSVSATPAIVGTNTYTVTATDATSGCTSTATVNVTVNGVPAAPVGTNSTQCGVGVPGASVAGSGGLYSWYLTPTGGTPIAGESGPSLSTYTVSSTTTFYVSESDGTCSGPRGMVIANVTQPDAIALTASSPTCSGTPITLTATQTGSTNTYVLSYSASPSGTSGLSGTENSSPITVTPTADGVYTYTVTATDAGAGCVTASSVIVNVTPNPVISSATASPSTVCAGNPVTLTGLHSTVAPHSGQIGTGTSTTTGQPNPYYTTFWGNKNQYLILASELTAAGYSAGNITSLGFNLGSVSTTLSLTNFTISMGNTALTVMPATFQTGLTQVYTNPAYNVIAAANTVTNHTFSTPFYWNGTSNLIIETCFNNSTWNGSQTISYTPTAANSAIYYYADAATVCSAPGTPTASVNRPNMYIVGTQGTSGPGSYTWQWGPGTIASGNVATVTPTSTTTYTVTATDPTSGCTSTATVDVTVNPLPLTPTATDGSHCGLGVPTCSVIGSGGIFSWYLVPTGGTAIAGETGASLTTYSVSTTTTFYVSESDGTCESARVAVVETVSDPDAVTASASPTSGCANTAFTLSAAQTGSTNTYTYSWSAIPATGSGISTSVSGQSVSVTPTAGGTFTYIVTATDAGSNCATTSSVTVTVTAPPVITSATASPSSLCLGQSTTLTALTSAPGPVLGQVGTGTSTTTGEPNPYYTTYWGNKNQYLILASEMTAAGYVAGNITSLGFNLGSVSTTLTLDNFTISMGNTALTVMPATFQTGLTQVYTNPSYNVIGAANTITNHAFSTPFYWNGTSNLIIETCFNNSNWNGAQTISYTNTAANSAIYYRADASTVCSSPGTPTASVARPNMYMTGNQITNGAGTYTWVWNPGSLTGNVQTVTPSSVGTSTYTVTATDGSTGCTATATVSVNVIATPPTPTVSSSVTTLCGPGTTVLTVTNAVPGGSYQWQSSPTGIVGSWSDISGATTTTYTSATLTADTYFRAYVSCSGSGDTSTSVLVTVLIPSIATTVSDTICGIGTVNLAVTGNGSFDWYQTSSSTTPLATNTATYSPTVSGTTTFWVQAYIGTCLDPSGRQPVQAIVTPAPSVSIANSGASTICSGTTLTLTASSSNDPNYTYSWSTDGGATTFASGASVSVTPMVNTTYTVLAVDNTTGTYQTCAAVSSVAITVNASPTVAPTASPNLICNTGTVVNLNANASGVSGGTLLNATFNSGADGFTATQTSSNSILIWALVNSSVYDGGDIDGTPYFEAESDQGGSGSVTNTTLFSPVVNAASYTSGLTLDWDEVYNYYSGGAESVHTDVWDGSAWVTVYTAPAADDGVNGAPVHHTVNISAYANANLQVRWVYQSNWGFYNGVDNVVINATSSSPSLLWTASPSDPSLAGQTTSATPAVTPTATTTYTVVATNSNGCTASGSVTVTYSPLTPPSITPSATSVCGGSNVTLDGGAGYTSYSWSDGTSVVGTSQVLSVNPTTTTTYTLTVSNGTCTATATQLITVNSVTVASITASNGTTLCAPSTTSLCVSPATFSSYAWSTSETSSCVTAAASGTYTVTVTDANGCSQTLSQAVTINPAPPTAVISIVGNPVICATGSVTLNADTTGAGPGASILWASDAFHDENSITVDNSWFDFILSNPWSVQFTVTNQYGCSTTSNSVELTSTTDPCAAAELDLKVYIQGYYVGGGVMQPVVFNQGVTTATGSETDTITVQAWTWDGINPPTLAGETKAMLMTDGTCTAILPAPDGSYYIAVRHRNSVATWSASTVALSSSTPATYDFSTDPMQSMSGQAADDLFEGIYSIYSGDINQDDFVDLFDYPDLDNDNYNFVSGVYVATDLNGDGFVDLFDYPILDANNYNFISAVHP